VGASRVNQVPHSKLGILTANVHTLCIAMRTGRLWADVWHCRGYILCARSHTSGEDATVSTKTPPASAHVCEDVYEDTILR
jgi:hypothetical protein